MAQQPEVVIVGADGTEHVFPSGFDPQKAAAIVRGRSTEPEPKPYGAARAYAGGLVEDIIPSLADLKATAAEIARRQLDLKYTYSPLARGLPGIVTEGIVQSHADRARKAGGAFSRAADVAMGKTGENPLWSIVELLRGARDAAGAAIPVVGPQAADILETAETDIPRAAGRATTFVAGPMIAGKVVGKVAPAVAGKLQTSAKADIREALDPTRHRTKVKTERIAPEIQRRGLTGDLGELRALASEKVATEGRKIGAALKPHAEETVSIKGLRARVAKMKAETYREPPVRKPGGAPMVDIEGTPIVARVVHNQRKLDQIQKVDDLLTKYGDEMTVEQANAVRQTWDEVVAKAGGYDEKAGRGAFGVSLDEATEAAVKRPLARGLRALVAQKVPSVKAINKEYGFWRDLEDVANASKFRKVGQTRRGLLSTVVGAAARPGLAATGALLAGVPGAVSGWIAGALAGRLDRVFRSASWKLTAAKYKTALADALASGNQKAVERAVGQIEAVHAATSGSTADIVNPLRRVAEYEDEQRRRSGLVAGVR